MFVCLIAGTAIRFATLADAGEIAVLSRDLIEQGLPWTWTPGRVARSIRDPDTNVVVAGTEGALSGFAIMYYAEDDAHDAGEKHDAWPLWKALAVLAAATAATAFEAELISGALEPTAAQLGLSEFFLGIILLAVIGNAAEYVSAMYFARKNQMGLAVSITVGSTIQIALLVAPVLVIVSALIGHPMNLVFSSPLELVAIGAVVFSVSAIAQDGETTWCEGLLLLAIYVLFGLAFYFV